MKAWERTMVAISLNLLVSHSPLQMNMSAVPNLTATLKPVIDRWKVRLFPRSGEEGRLKAQYTLKRGQACGRFLEGVLHIFSPCEVLASILLAAATVRS